MRLDITFRNMKPSDRVRDRAEKKFQKVAKHLREPIEADLVLKMERHRHSAELRVSGAGDSFTAHEASEDLYNTIDSIMTKVERTVRRAKERSIDRQQAAGPQFDPS